MFHTVCYQNLGGAAAQTNTDMPAATDTVLALRNSHLIFTDPFVLGLAYAMGQTITAVRFNTPTLNTYARMQIWPLDNPAATPPTVADRPALVDYMQYPIAMPQNEEIAIEYTNTAATAEREAALLWLFTPNHSLQLPPGITRITVKATAAINPGTIGVWTGASALTFSENLRGGWYSVVGLNCEGAAGWAARLIFPRAIGYSGRILRPGCIIQQAYGNRPADRFMGRLGIYGVFHSFEPVQAEVISGATGSVTFDFRLDLIYHGDTPPAGYVLQP